MEIANILSVIIAWECIKLIFRLIKALLTKIEAVFVGDGTKV